jgi:hypothetical protein
MPQSKEEIFKEIVSKIDKAASDLDAFGCSMGSPRIQDDINEAAGLLWGALTTEERSELADIVPYITYAIYGRTIRCPDIPRIKDEAEKFRLKLAEKMVERRVR